MSYIERLKLTMERLFEKKEVLSDAEYLDKCNHLKSLHDNFIKNNKYLIQVQKHNNEYIEITHIRIQHLE